MKDTAVSIEIGPDVVKPIIEAKINTLLAESLGAMPRIVDNMVRVFLAQKVDSDGKPSNYSHSQQRFDYLLHRALEDAMKAAITQFMADKQAVVADALRKYFSSAAGTRVMVKAMEEGIVESMKSAWNFRVVMQPVQK